ncbi:hypothetical protein COU54_01730 [Candidatus Pacearchaeota archaeon CG10_big_fil_rev_8_21_14_0_10_31_24]|nr:MAG: hypothetical protein COU54_01730 [Candidatus Pacearchaeota archaeon CG10_big_fil_rev_8_21_14_0_10_31_24]
MDVTLECSRDCSYYIQSKDCEKGFCIFGKDYVSYMASCAFNKTIDPLDRVTTHEERMNGRTLLKQVTQS